MAELRFSDSHTTLYLGNSLHMSEIPDNSVHCVVTSPPYWGQRVYKGSQENDWPDGTHEAYGLEKTPEAWISHTLMFLREIRRVLRKDGIVWFNVDDKRWGSGTGTHDYREQGSISKTELYQELSTTTGRHPIIKPLDLCLIPQRLAIACQADGWYVRSVVMWTKPNPMPESVAGWTFSRHRVTIEQYEKLQIMRRSKSPGQDGAAGLPILQGNQGEGIEVSLQPQREGEGKGSCTFPQEVYPHPENQTIRGRTGGKRTGKGTSAGTGPGAESQTERIQAPLAANREGQGIHSKPMGKTNGPNEEYRRSDDRGGLARDQDTPQLSMFLLQEENADLNNGSRHSSEQRGQPYERECSPGLLQLQLQETRQDNSPLLVDCPGCPKCLPNDGLVLRKGSWRPTESYETILMLTKSDKYFADQEAVREPHTTSPSGYVPYFDALGKAWGDHSKDSIMGNESKRVRAQNPAGRNLRDVWQFPTQAYAGAHFATFPEKLPEICIKASTSERGICPVCGAQWARVIRPSEAYQKALESVAKEDWYPRMTHDGYTPKPNLTLDYQTLGWRPTCTCGREDTVPATILDPFCGAGTTLWVAKKLGRRSIGCDLSEQYCAMALERTRQEGLL